jgi:tetratricopeptide (TPR) repeat protein
MYFRLFFLLFLMLTSIRMLDAQARWLKKYEEAEKNYKSSIEGQEDFETAAKALGEMQVLVQRKAEAKDEVYAKTQIYQIDYWLRTAQLFEADSLLSRELASLEEWIEAGEKLSSTHYRYWLTAANIQLSLATAHKKGNAIPGLLKTPEWVRKAKKPYETAVLHLEKAIDYYQKYQELEAGQEQIAKQLAFLFREKGEIEGRYLQKLDDCIQSFQTSLEFEKAVETYRFLGVAYGIKAEHFKAIEAFEAALKLDERNLAILYNLEVAYRQLAANNVGPKSEEYRKKADSYQIKWKSIDPNYQPGG